MHVPVVTSCTLTETRSNISIVTIQVHVPLSSLVLLVIVIFPSIDILKQPPGVMNVLSGPIQVTLGTGIPSISICYQSRCVILDSTI